MKPTDYPNLARTAAAMDEFDRVHEKFSAHVSSVGFAEAERLFDQLAQAARAVSEAFAADTADRNPRDNALLMGVTPKQSHPDNDCTLRKWVREWRERQHVPEIQPEDTK